MKSRKMDKIHSGNGFAVGMVSALVALVVVIPVASDAVLPDNLTVNAGDIDSDGQDEVLVLTKRSMRSSWNHKLLTWDSTNGYVEITPPEVRTYRGYVQDDISMRVNASIEPGNTNISFNLSDGHVINLRRQNYPIPLISGPEGTPDPGTGNTVVPLVADRTAPTTNHYIVPVHNMRRLDYAVTIQSSYITKLGSLEAAVCRVEQRLNDGDFYYARDMGLAYEIGWMVVNLEDNPTSWHGEWTNVHKPNGAVYEMRAQFKSAGGAGASGDCFRGGRHSAGSTSSYSRSQGHELGHTLGAGHWSSWGDAMSGSESALGSGTVERMIGNAHIATEAQSPQLVYSSPLPPFAMEDCVTMLMDTTLDIDVLENDYDGNGDTISISYVDAVTKKGGTATNIAGKVRYTPPPHWQGQDEFVYHVEDSTGIANRTGYVKVAVHNNGLATHILFDETSGTKPADVGPFQAHGKLDKDLTFDANSVAGVAGNALKRTTNNNAKASADFWGTGDPLDGDLSVSLWVKYQDAVPTVKGPVICKGGSVIRGRFGNPRGGWDIGHTADGRFRFEGNLNRDSQSGFTYTNTQFDIEADSPVSSNTWYHLAMVMDRSNQLLRAWVDGVELSTTTFGTVIADGVIDNSHHPLVVFDSVSQQDQSTDTPVTVDDVRIYHKALSPAEVTNLFNNPTADIAAGAPSPANAQDDILVGSPLNWTPGKPTGYQFDVYFGTNYTDVLNATTNSPEYLGRQADTSVKPSMQSGTRHFWRIDEVAGATNISGDVWWFDSTTTEGGLADPSVVNGSFENPVLAAGESSDSINDWWDAVAYTYTADDGAFTHPDTPYGDNWAEIDKGRWIYQQIGTYKENMDLDISFLLGRRSDKGGLNVYASLLVGGDPELVGDETLKITFNPLTNIVGAVVITNSAVIPPLASAGSTAEQAFTLSTGTGHIVGSPLWLQIATTDVGSNDRVLIDNIQVVDPSAVNQPPEFNANPIGEADGTIGKLYSSSLADNASDPESDPLSFAKVSGPAWLVVATDGELSGTPGVTANGLNTFSVQVDDGNGGTVATGLEIEVLIDDSDGDGMSDLWETQYFTNGVAALPGENADGDVHSNLEEFIAGMNPTNANAYFHITDCSLTTNGFVVEWPSVAGRFYRVNRAASLTSTFQILEDHIEFPRNSYTDSVHHVEGQGFYKVDVRLK